MTGYPVMSNANFDSLAEVAAARSFHNEGKIFSSAIRIYGTLFWHLVNILFHYSLSPIGFIILILKSVITIGVAKL